jgi:4-amino-4-deoxy-L-arabinose transferase-like glycosyltransferase
MQEALFILSVFMHLVAVIFFLRGQNKAAIFVLFSAGILLRFYIIGLDPFFHSWDERFHALVAKNFTKHWLTPTLIDSSLLPLDHTYWVNTHIWLHKQPLFLWQMALSIRLFGLTEFAVRLPSMLMTAMLIPVIYKTGERIFSKRTGFIAALMFSCYEPILELISGFGNTEHNDTAFIFYVTISIY